MRNRRQWRRVLIAAVLALGMVPSRGFAFLESTETQGELPTNLNGMWLVVSNLEFTKGGAEATPNPGTSPVPSPASGAAKKDDAIRHFSVVNLFRIVHYPKAQAEKMREGDRKMEEASTEKAKALVAEEQKKAIPVQTETGEVQSDVNVIVPSVPAKRQPGTGDDVDIYLQDVAFPKSIQDEIDKAQKAEKPWTPTDKDLALLKTSLGSLKPSGRDEYSKIEWKVISPDNYDDNFKIDESTKDAKFVISANEEMIPKPNVPKTNVLVFGPDKVKGNVISGKHTRAMMATAPFPLPIEMKGTFVMYKVADLPGAADKSAAKPEEQKTKKSNKK